jgi:hypothetical protein
LSTHLCLCEEVKGAVPFADALFREPLLAAGVCDFSLEDLAFLEPDCCSLIQVLLATVLASHIHLFQDPISLVPCQDRLFHSASPLVPQ